MFNIKSLEGPKMGEVATSFVQIGSVMNGSIAHAAQIQRYVSSGYASVNKLYSECNSISELYQADKTDLFQLGESIALLASSILSSKAGAIIHSSLEVRSAISDWMEGRKKDAVIKVSFTTLSLAAQLTLNIHARVLLIAVTVLLDLQHSFDSFQEKRYIESASSAVCAALRVGKNRDLLQKCKNLWSSTQIERRVAVDVGSGGTKVIIADVDTKTNRVVKVIHQESIPVAYQKDLESSSDGSFSPQIQKEGMQTFQKIKELAVQHQADKISAVATAAFRSSNNGKDFAKKITESTKIPVRVISQFDEGVLAYESVMHSPKLPSKEFVCWDIGTGSFQITSSEGNQYEVYMTETGSVPFKKYIIEEVKRQDSSKVDNPIPLNKEEVKKADSKARRIGRGALKSIKARIKSHDRVVIGIGRLFQNSLGPIAEGDEIIRKDLRGFIKRTQKAPSSDPYAGSDLSNAVLVLGAMKGAGIHRIRPIEGSTSSNGVLVHQEYWTA